MNQVLDFIVENWKLILTILMLVIAFILALVRKKPKSDIISYVRSRLADFLPLAINEVETPGSGEYKKKLVTNLALKLVVDIYGRVLTDDETNFYTSIIENMIEKFLETPQKKGD